MSDLSPQLIDLERIHADIERSRGDKVLVGEDLKWYEKMLWIGVGGVLFQGAPKVLDSMATFLVLLGDTGAIS